ncbi:MAG: sigma-70 family RNA polymerase sigma factor [Bacteroidaceae bacterium]|nr:sigma-70 family RNA polymerase sigma factor [Bacteroidaceae bacterium]
MNSQQFRSLVTEYHRRLFRAAYHLLGNVEDAEDAVQDAYMKLWKIRNSLDEVENMESYCVSTVRRICLDRLRANNLDMRTEINQISETCCSSDNLERTLEDKNVVEHLQNEIQKLPSGQKLAVTMRDIEGHSIEEIEAASGYTAVNIRALLSRGRKTLREQLLKSRNYGH